ncbi:peptidase M61 [Christiangramia fulva]|uniref:Peptidase M61 n=1 Tax=Christiangramia fulva TaxID=2126553 RepID=A0A2R3Z2Q2_9FLAO|nr:PDZ domain-containing protein [Christiangramia fulva]AVR44527.1 peptidase M61 [Christiangramia fulva]
MRRILLIFLFLGFIANAQTNIYSISFENAEHHEAKIKATFPHIKDRSITVRMSRSSPGRYALHEFAKNVYGLKATDGHGKELEVTRPDPYSWKIENTDGTINVQYTLFGNHGDGTYSQIDETHAHLNIPATFMYAEDYQGRPIEVNFDVREDLNWKVATQLKKISGTKYSAPNLYYFMDSPTEISDYQLREFELGGQTIQFVLHDQGTEAELDEYFEQVKKIVKQEQAVYGELPNYDYGRYTFLVCYMPNVDGDGMEHRNSTIVTSTRSLANGGMKRNLGTIAHEYFHCWNVERIRPAGLEPFDFSKANMSGCLWFAEGFTSYYDGLIRCRANITTPEEYINDLTGTFNYVWNSPAHQFFNPIEMSYQAPFVDAATSVDPVNRENMFISYYSYGSVLGLALDLSLREKGLNLDDFMEKMWMKYGKTEVAYEVEDIETTLKEYAGDQFAEDFFNNYIYGSKMPDYSSLFKDFGIELTQKQDAYFGASVRPTDAGLEIYRNTAMGSPAYEAGLDEGDVIISIKGNPVSTSEDLQKIIEENGVGAQLKIGFKRYNESKETTVTLQKSPNYNISLDENASQEAVRKREKWLAAK